MPDPWFNDHLDPWENIFGSWTRIGQLQESSGIERIYVVDVLKRMCSSWLCYLFIISLGNFVLKTKQPFFNSLNSFCYVDVSVMTEENAELQRSRSSTSHQQRKRRESLFSIRCLECNLGFTRKRALQQHWLQCHPEKEDMAFREPIRYR
jgi:hypothetical protein